MEDAYKQEGIVLQRLYNDYYKVKVKNGRNTRRHASQLKSLRKGMLEDMDETVLDVKRDLKQDVS